MNQHRDPMIKPDNVIDGIGMGQTHWVCEIWVVSGRNLEIISMGQRSDMSVHSLNPLLGVVYQPIIPNMFEKQAMFDTLTIHIIVYHLFIYYLNHVRG